MNIQCFTPAPRGSVKGNRITAERWKRLLEELGHEFDLVDSVVPQPCDVAIAIHAGKSAVYMATMKSRYPDTPVILCLSGTDLYRDLHRDETIAKGIDSADRLIVLQSHALTHLKSAWADKAAVVLQSCIPPRDSMTPLKKQYEVLVVGHLRPVKDPLRTAMAVRRLPAGSRIHVNHLGSSLSKTLELRAVRESINNGRYNYEGVCARSEVLKRIERAKVLVLSSKLEGGANVLSEAICCGTPVLASRVSGSIGILGESYPGLFEVGDTEGLRTLLMKCETSPSFYEELSTSIAKIAKHYTPSAEKRAWRRLLASL